MEELNLIKLPEWHVRSDRTLKKSLDISYGYAPHLKNLSDCLITKMPRLVRASQNLKSINIDHSSHLFSLNQAIDLPWISFDSKEVRNVLLLDIDHDEGLAVWEDLPDNIKPHLVIDPWSGRSAGIFVLKTPILTREGTRFKPQFFADACHQMIAEHFNATALPHGSLTKNPFGMAKNVIGQLSRRSPYPTTGIMWDMHQQANTGLLWHTVPGAHEIELRDIVAFFADGYERVAPKATRRKFSKKRGEPSYIGRNCYVFDLTRWHCYDHREKDLANIQQKAEEVSQTMDNPLSQADVRSISRSIHRYMNTVFNPLEKNPNAKRNQINRGIMNLAGTRFDQKQKQKLSAKRSSDMKASTTEDKIRQALIDYPKDRKLSQREFSKFSELSLKTVERHWHIIKNISM